MTKTQALKEFSRMRGVTGYPKGAEDEHVMALLCSAAGPDHARRIMDRLLETTRRDESGYVNFPTPAEIRDAAKLVPTNEKTWTADEECRDCGGSGWRACWYLVTWQGKHKSVERVTVQQAKELAPKCKGLGKQEVYEAAEECGCRRVA